MLMKIIFSSNETAVMLGVKPQTLRIWRLKGIGPAYIRYGGKSGRVVYRLQDIEEWLASNRFFSTTQETVADGKKRKKCEKSCEGCSCGNGKEA